MNDPAFSYCTQCGSRLDAVLPAGTAGSMDASPETPAAVSGRGGQPIYMKAFQKMGGKGRPHSINWAAGFFGGFWFVYRKMYLIGALLIILQVLLTWFWSAGSVGVAVFCLVTGDWIYREHLSRLVHACEMLPEEERRNFLKRKGGTSELGVLLSILGACTLLLIAMVLW